MGVVSASQRKKDYCSYLTKSYIPARIRKEVLKRDKNRCVFCGAPTNFLCHAVPKCRGGKTTVDNLLTCCRKCSREKGEYTPLEWFFDGYFKENFKTKLDFEEEKVKIKVKLKDEVIYGESNSLPRNNDNGFWMMTEEGIRRFVPINDNLIYIQEVKDGKKNNQ